MKNNWITVEIMITKYFQSAGSQFVSYNLFPRGQSEDEI